MAVSQLCGVSDRDGDNARVCCEPAAFVLVGMRDGAERGYLCDRHGNDENRKHNLRLCSIEIERLQS